MGVLVWKCQPFLEQCDKKANLLFANKAKELRIEGRNREYVKSHFGSPVYTKMEEEREIWIFKPGPILALWRSDCKIVFDERANVVIAWQVNSD